MKRLDNPYYIQPCQLARDDTTGLPAGGITFFCGTDWGFF